MISKSIQCLLLLACIIAYRPAEAHSLPNSNAQLTVNGKLVLIQFKTPLEVLELAAKRTIDLQSPASVDSLKQYFLSHLAVTDSLHSKWTITIGKSFIQETTDPVSGKYQEIVTEIYLEPDNASSLRDLTLNCDLIIHQIPNQSILFSVKQEEQNGSDAPKQIGVISLDIPSGKIFPLRIQFSQEGWGTNFRNMIALGMQHIKEGTDHLLFLIVLLLPATLLIKGRQWGQYGGLKYSVTRLLKIVTAFTIGHSITLLTGSLGWINLPSRPIEILIAVSILVSAIHAVYPLFPGRERYIAAGFGLIHGLAFAGVLGELKLGAGTLAISILGFNLGIELMQLMIIAMVIPWLVLLSKTPYYKWGRIIAAILAGIAAVAWVMERSSGKGNLITGLVEKGAQYSVWGIMVLAIGSLVIYKWHQVQLTNKQVQA